MRFPVWRLVAWTLVALVGFAVLFPLLYSSLTPEARGAKPSLPLPPAGEYEVFVVDWGYHTAVLVEQPSGWRLGPPGEERAPFLEYAWGDRSFFLESDYRPHVLFATVALPTASVVYLDGRPDPPRLAGARSVYRRTVDATTLHAMMTTLERSAHRTPAGARLQPDPGVAENARQFYISFGRYLWTRNCNWWIVERLREAGLAGSSVAVVFSGQVSGRLQGFERVDVQSSDHSQTATAAFAPGH